MMPEPNIPVTAITAVISTLITIVPLIAAYLKGPSEKNLEALRAEFNDKVIPNFKKLEDIHKDYMQNLVQLRQKLENRNVHPKELIDWFETEGVEYRHQRDALRAADSDLSIDPTSDKAEAFVYLSREFSRSVQRYLCAAAAHTERSIYRAITKTLTDALSLHQRTGHTDNAFYERPEVLFMCELLRKTTDVSLPKAWEDVNAKFNSVKQALRAL
jgi:hypothetical protein